MPITIKQAAQNFMLEVIWQDDIAPILRRLGVRTDKKIEGPKRSNAEKIGRAHV